MKKKLGSLAGSKLGRGGALVASLMVVVVVASIGVVMVQMHSALTRQQVHSIDKRRAFYIAEAGLSESFMALSYGKSGNVGDEEVPAEFGQGVYWVEATELENGKVALVSTGLCGTGRFTLSAVISTEVAPVTSLGVFSGHALTVRSSCIIDGYDSLQGSYEDQLVPGEEYADGNAQLHSNGSVYLLGNPTQEGTRIYGDVHPGQDSHVLMGTEVEVSGSTAPVESDTPLPEIKVPYFPSLGDVVVSGDQEPFVIVGSEIGYDVITVQEGGTLEIVGPVNLLVEGLWLKAGAQVVFDTLNGPVTVYCDDFIALDEGSLVRCPQRDPTSIAVLVDAFDRIDIDGDGSEDLPVRVEASGELYGFLYAPDAKLDIPASLRIYGALAAKRLTLMQGARVTFDQALANTQTGLEYLPKLMAWHIVKLPDTPLVNLRLDPLTQLQLQGIAPIRSSEAHMEQNLIIVYFDLSGVLQSYNGPESDFDWTTVRDPIAVDWF